MAATFKPWTPYGTPPADRYDPSLDATLAAGERGYGDLVTNAGISNRRATEDYGFGASDIGTQRTYATQDHARAIQMLQRQYAQLGSAQGQQANVMGVSGGGALVQAARKRAENEAIDQQPIDTQLARTNTGLDTQLARLGVNTARGIQDTTLGVQRGGREQIFLGTDTAAAKSAQAAASGWDPGAQPKNEFVGGQYGDHRVIARGNTDYIVDPSGKVLGTRPRKAR